MIVAVHQPNYLPWLGYFAKMARADIFVFLDDVQFSKGSYTNRVQVARDGKAVWMTVPVRHALGTSICDVEIARPDWSRSHADFLKQSYRKARHFDEVWRELEAWLENASGRLSAINASIIMKIASRLGLKAKMLEASRLNIEGNAPDQRLAAIAATVAPGGVYLSGGGGANYQSEDAFSAQGIKLRYSDFQPLPYDCGGTTFIPGLSIVDALFHHGFEATAELIRPAN